MRPLILAVLITAAGSYVSSCGESITPTQSVGLRTQDPLFVKKAHVVIDGVMSPGEWSGAATLPFMTSDAPGLVPATLYVKVDATNLYLAIKIGRPTTGQQVGATFEFDNNDDGVAFEVGDDQLIVSLAPGGSGINDAFRDATGTTADHTSGGTTDGDAAVGSDATSTTIEVVHPLNSGDTGHDIAISSAAPEVGMFFSVILPLPGIVSPFTDGEWTKTTVAGNAAYCKLNIGPPVSIGPCTSGNVASVRITPFTTTDVVDEATLTNPSSRQLGLSAFDYLGNPVTSSCIWQSQDPTIATVDQSGVVQTVSTGSTVIIAACLVEPYPYYQDAQLKVTVLPP